jgi:outer membrane protein assembly factor BamB/tetratricopeptide (TPR) repeat protein
MTGRFQRILLFSTLSFSFITFLVAPSIAQNQIVPPTGPNVPAKKDDKLVDAFSVQLDRDASNKIEAIKQYLAKKQPPWDTICPTLQKLLEANESSFIEIDQMDPRTKQSRKARVNIKEEVNRMIGSFSDEGKQFYQLSYGQQAEARLQEGIQSRDQSILAEVAQRYLHTKAGAKAVIQLGTWRLDRGQYIPAALTFQKLKLLGNDILTPAQRFHLALASKRMGDEASSDQYWKEFVAALGPKQELVLSGRTIKLSDFQAEYDRAYVQTGMLGQSEWFVGLGGTYSRNGRGIGGRPFMEPRLNFSMMPIPQGTLANPQEAKNAWQWLSEELAQILDNPDDRKEVMLSRFFPIAAKGKIIFRTYDSVYCMATRDEDAPDLPIKAGEILWRAVHSDNSLFAMIRDTNSRNITKTWYEPYRNDPQLKGILFENGLVGSLSHDGNNVYYIDDLALPPFPQPNLNMPQGGNGSQGYGPFESAITSNSLVAVNIETGKLIFKTCGRANSIKTTADGKPIALTESQQALSDGLFLGAPLPLGGKLYVIMEKDREMRLLCIDPTRVDELDFPYVVWSQTLGTPDTFLPQETRRRVQGVNLAYSDGILVCPTNSGALVGVDLLEHSLLWAHSYRDADPQVNRSPNPVIGGGAMRRGIFVPNNGITDNRAYTTDSERWRLSVPYVSRGKVVFTAYDSLSVQCLDLRTGNLLWKHQRAPGDLYVAGIFEDRVMIVAKNSIRFLKLDSNKPEGEKIGSEVTDIGIPSGVGTGSGNRYFLPVRASNDFSDPGILTIDVLRGVIEARTRSRKKVPAGNLLLFENDVYSQTPLEIVSFPQLQIKIDEMVRRLKLNPKDPLGLAEQGDLLLDDGKVMPAIETLKQAISIGLPTDAAVRYREKLHDAFEELIRGDFQKIEPFLKEYEDLCHVSIPADANEATKKKLLEEQLRRDSTRLLYLAKGREEQGRLDEALKHYMSFGLLIGNRKEVESPDEPGTTAAPSVWALGRISAMMSKASPEQRKPLMNELISRWDAVKKSNDQDQLQSFVNVFGLIEPVGNDARLTLASRLIDSKNVDDQREAQKLFGSLRKVSDRNIAAKASERLAKLYIDIGLLDDAMAIYADLSRSDPDVMIRDGMTGSQLYEERMTDKRFLPHLDPVRPNWPAKVNVTDSNGTSTFATSNALPSFTLEPAGELLPYFDRHRVVLQQSNQAGQVGWVLLIIDRLTGEEKFRSRQLTQMLAPTQLMQNQNQNPNLQTNVKLVSVQGHLLILNMGHQLSAFDLSAPHDNKPIWEFDLLGRRKNTRQPVVSVATDPNDGITYLIYQGNRRQRVGEVGVIESSYVCLTTQDGVVALDPSRGTKLWTRTNVSPRAKLTGDDQYVFIFDRNVDGSHLTTRAVRASDGVAVPNVPDSSEIFQSGRKIRMMGRKVLIQEETKDAKKLRLYDLLTGKDLWVKTLHPSTIWIRSEDSKSVGYLLPNTEFSMIHVATGETAFQGRLEPKLNVLEGLVGSFATATNFASEAVWFTDRDRNYLGLVRPTETGGNFMSAINVGIPVLKVNGAVYCFDRVTSKRLWFTEEQFRNQAIIMDQFRDLPVLVGVATPQQQQNYSTKVVIIEKSTGKLKFRRDLQQGVFTSFKTDPKNFLIELYRNDLRIQIRGDSESKPVAVNPRPVP